MSFYTDVVPAEGYSAFVDIAGYAKHAWRTALGDGTPSEVGDYFTLATYANPGTVYAGRTQENAAYAKALWLDIDAGDAKRAKHGDAVYRNVDEALFDLDRFCTAIDMPRPTYIVKSGEGLHVYWAFTYAVEATTWIKFAERLKQACKVVELKADASRTTDIASILRTPGTVHPNGNIVSFEKTGVLIDPLDLIAVLKQFKPQTPAAIPVESRLPYSIFNILSKTQHGEGCAQLSGIIAASGNVPEPLWRAGLSVVQHAKESLETRHKVMHLMSNGHPSYSEGETIQKAENTKAVTGCSTFAALNPAGCAGCPFQNSSTIYNPAQLGYTPHATRKEVQALEISRVAPLQTLKGIPHASTPIKSVTGSNNDTPNSPAADHQSAGIHHGASIPYAGPNPSAFRTLRTSGFNADILFESDRGQYSGSTYIRGQWEPTHGGVSKGDIRPIDPTPGQGVTRVFIKRVRNDDGEMVPEVQCVIVSNLTIYCIDQFNERKKQTHNARIVLRIDPFFGESREVSMLLSTIANGDATFKNELGSQAIIPAGEQLKEIQVYLKSFSDKMQRTSLATSTNNSLGWTDDHSFLLGQTEYFPDGTKKQVTLPAHLNEFTKVGEIKGDLELWNTALSAFYCKHSSRYLPHQFTILAGFGAPLHSLKESAFGGAISLVSEDSGTGKSMAQKWASMIYGPYTLFQKKSDTSNITLCNSMGAFNSLPIFVDEITDQSVERMSDFIYSTTSGKGKDRSTQSGMLRENVANWRSFTFLNSNEPLIEAVQRARGASDGISKRVLEIMLPKMPEVSLQEASEVEDFVGAVYGVAGNIWIKHLVENRERLLKSKAKIEAILCEQASLNVADRFLASMVASALTAGIEAGKLGLHPFDSMEVFEWAINLLKGLRKTVAAGKQTPENLILTAISKSLDCVLVIHNDTLTLNATPLREIRVRIEVHRKKVYLSRTFIMDLVREQRFPKESLMRYIESLGGILRQKRFGAGTTKSELPAVYAWEMDMDNPNVKLLFGELDGENRDGANGA